MEYLKLAFLLFFCLLLTPRLFHSLSLSRRVLLCLSSSRTVDFAPKVRPFLANVYTTTDDVAGALKPENSVNGVAHGSDEHHGSCQGYAHPSSAGLRLLFHVNRRYARSLSRMSRSSRVYTCKRRVSHRSDDIFRFSLFFFFIYLSPVADKSVVNERRKLSSPSLGSRFLSFPLLS